jgi:hypothetical protein
MECYHPTSSGAEFPIAKMGLSVKNQRIKRDFSGDVTSSLARPTIPIAATSALRLDAASCEVRFGFSGAIWDLYQQGRLTEELISLIEKERDLACKLSELEQQLRQCHDPVFVLPLIRDCEKWKLNGADELEAQVKRLDAEKK